ncbi:hypothetical protein HBH69_094040 [Parastagonospora nodorum]|nr:hypothetical protein HBH50_152360 [Parastagonospora nodorum]KAH4079464.1 hypothetical protein HBH48_219140 [Parastagonospora nodorum]KAH4115886.1 hypothetical protein HBH47_173110 [Parastagonospora nodorum]KAH5032047.1 hypothetical protein HBI74_078090 [Parastagonospora nodorum]KAH5156660.1 hypothetical protein HBH69_094040 [Parastagonospora nodorum]
MAIYQRKQTKILLTFKVLQFVNQLRRRVRPRTLHGSFGVCPLGADALGLRAIKRIPSGRPRACSVRNTTPLHHRPRRVCKRRKSNASAFGTSPAPRAAACIGSAASDTSGEQVQHLLSCVGDLNPAHALVAVAGNNKLFLKHHNATIIEGCSLNQTIQLLVAVREALCTFAACRSQYGDDWLLIQSLGIGLDIDDTFIANYEHLLLQLQAELVQVLARKALEELLRGGHDKRQRKLLAWFTEFAEKPRPLSTTFPWTIKASLAVLWGVCWMFYDRDSSEHDAKADTRVRQNRLLEQLDLSNNVPWSAPASSDYRNFGLELIGQQPQHTMQQADQAIVTAGLQDVFQARNTETWESDHSPLGFRLPSHEDVGAMGLMRYGQAPPQMPGQSTYYNHDLQMFPVESHDSHFLPHNPGSPLTAFPHLGTDGNHNAWQPLYTSLPPNSRRHLIPGPQTPSIRVTGAAGSDLAQPQLEFASFSAIYPQQPQATLHLNTNFDYPNSQYNIMGSQISPDTTAIPVPHNPIKHERTSSIASVSNILTPISMSGPRSPLPSPTAGERPLVPTTPPTHSINDSEDRSSPDGEDDGSLRKNFSYKRAEEPPRNQEGKMTCRHHECAGVFFDRKCEWSKHMDKHDRPYKCNVKGCEKLQGFTYSGGLLRHEREVHKMHGGTKKSLFCPFHDCKRSSGAGFTRKENLAEHIRRVHRRTSMSADMHGLIIRRETTMDRSPIPESRHASESPYVRTVDYRGDDDDMSLKRKRGSDSVISERDSEDLRSEVKRLRQENEEKDSRLRQLEQAVMALQHQTRR